MPVQTLVDSAENFFPTVIAGFTVVAMLLVENRQVELKDLLSMFIYAEVLGMLGASTAGNAT